MNFSFVQKQKGTVNIINDTVNILMILRFDHLHAERMI